MTLSFDQSDLRICDEFKDLGVEVSLGLIVYCLRSAHAISNLQECIAEEIAKAQRILSGGKPSSLPAIQAARLAFKRLGKDPSRYRPSSEALLRRISAGKELYRVNDVVDLSNIVSIHTHLPVCSYDMDRLERPLTFRRGTAGEHYQGLGRADLNLESLPVFSDRLGPFGTPFSDSERSKVCDDTVNVLTILVGFGAQVDVKANLAWSKSLFSKYLDLETLESWVIRQ